MSDTNADTGTNDSTATERDALTLTERAAELRHMASEASDFGGLRHKLDKVASFAEAVAAELAALRTELEVSQDFNEQAALQVAQRLADLEQREGA
jgi:hypothetical protein